MTRPQRSRRGRPVLTGRALLCGLVLIFLVVLLASPVRRYVQSRDEVSQAQQQLIGDRSERARLTKLQQLWSDPGYVEQQARQRLEYAMPGDTVYQVVRAGQPSQIDRTSGVVPGSRSARAWNTRLWDSVRASAQ